MQNLKKFNKNKLITYFIIIFFLSVWLLLFFQGNIYADSIIEDNPFNKFEKSNISKGYEYIGYFDSNNTPTLFIMNGAFALSKENNGCVVSGGNHKYLIYKYNNSSWDLYLQNNSSKYEPINIDIYLNNIKYSSYDLSYLSEPTVVFRKSPFGIVQEVPTIRGGMTSKKIVALALNWTEYLVPLVLGLVISVVAFRKAWTMLKTLLVGA